MCVRVCIRCQDWFGGRLLHVRVCTYVYALEDVQHPGAEGREAEDGGAGEAGVRDEQGAPLHEGRLGSLAEPGLAERLCVCFFFWG